MASSTASIHGRRYKDPTRGELRRRSQASACHRTSSRWVTLVSSRWEFLAASDTCIRYVQNCPAMSRCRIIGRPSTSPSLAFVRHGLAKHSEIARLNSVADYTRRQPINPSLVFIRHRPAQHGGIAPLNSVVEYRGQVIICPDIRGSRHYSCRLRSWPQPSRTPTRQTVVPSAVQQGPL